MKKRISNAILKRLDNLSGKVLSGDVPALTFIDRAEDGNGFSVCEHYYSPRGNEYKRFTINSPEEYKSKGGVVFHAYDLDDED